MNGVNQELLLCRVGERLCALPLEHVIETMRPLPVVALAGAPGFVRGLSIVRGAPVPVVTAAALLGDVEPRPFRFVIVRADGRQFAMAVEAVLGVKAIPKESLHDLAPLLRDAGSDLITAIGALDAELLLVLRSARIVPDSVWEAVRSEASR